MSTDCAHIKALYELIHHQTTVLAEQTQKVKREGDLDPVKRFIAELQETVERFYVQLPVFFVSSAKHPYREALIKAGIPEDQEPTELVIKLDMRTEIESQMTLYRPVQSPWGEIVLDSWNDNIHANKDMLLQAIARDAKQIRARIRAGMVPIVMPCKAVQKKTWMDAMESQKPLFIAESRTQSVIKNSMNYDVFLTNMNEENFFRSIPDRPYLVWTFPSQEVHPHTTQKTIAEQKTYYAQLVKAHPELFDSHSLTPIEYSAFQRYVTHQVVKQFKRRQPDTTPRFVSPLDEQHYTRFLTASLFLAETEAFIPAVLFADDHISYTLSQDIANPNAGFRPASRT